MLRNGDGAVNPMIDVLSFGACGVCIEIAGRFRFVGFFKTVRGSRFARWDTLLFSPLCLLLGLAVAIIALL